MRHLRLSLLLVFVVLVPAPRAGADATLPAVTGVAPAAGPATGGTAVTIDGSGFTGSTTVMFGSAPAASFQVRSDSTITAVAPAGTGTVDVVVATPSGSSPASSADSFAYVPVVIGISPSSGTVSGGTQVTVTGAGLAGATSVSFGDRTADSFVVKSDSTIVATAPEGGGTVHVRVTGPTGTSSAGAGDAFARELALTAVDPGSGPNGTQVQLNGIGFAVASAVHVGDSASGFAVLSDTRMLVFLPPGSGTVDITVETPYGTTATTPQTRFSYTTGGTTATGSSTTDSEPPAQSGSGGSGGASAGSTSSARTHAGRPAFAASFTPPVVATAGPVRILRTTVSTAVTAGVSVEILGARGMRIAVHRFRLVAGASRLVALRVPGRSLVRGRVYRIRVTAVDRRHRRVRIVQPFTA